jgi:hypothetical protein
MEAVSAEHPCSDWTWTRVWAFQAAVRRRLVL